MEQARLAAGWLKQKSKLLPVLIIITLVGMSVLPAFIAHSYAATANNGGGGTADALWSDNYFNLVYNGKTFSGPSNAATGDNSSQAFVSKSKTSKGCGMRVVFDSNYKTATTARYQTNDNGKGQCLNWNSGTFISVDPTASQTEAAAAAKSAANSGKDNADSATKSTDDEDPCDASANPLSWIVCPLVGLVNEGVIQMQRIIDHLMAVNVSDVFDYSKSPGKNYYAAWNSFRLFGVVLIVIAGLVMVISQGLGFEIFDAYTVRKVLPRLFVAAIGISLSWWLLKFLAEFTNDLGLGIRSIIYYPFRTMGNAGLQNTGSYLITLLFGSVALWALSIGGVFSLILTAGLAALVAFLVLVIRQIVLIFLIVMAPLAIACYVLPNTEKMYKLWWDSLFKGMMMFPIISGFIAIGHVFSVVASNASGGAGSSINQVIALIAFFIPYFALPFTFRLAGGAIATLGGLANDRSRGAFDGLKNYRKNKTGENWHKTKEGNRFRNNSMLGRGFNKTSRAIATAPAAGINPMQMRSRYTAASAQHTYDQAEEIRTKNADFALGAQDDRILKAVQNGKGRADMRRILQKEGISSPAELDTAVGVAERMQATGSREAVRAAAAMQRFATGTGYNDDNGNFDYQAAMGSLRDVSHGDRALGGRLLGTAKGVSAQAGQTAFGGASYMTLSKGLDQSWAGGSVSGEDIAYNAFMSNDAVTIARARLPHVKAMTEAASRRLEGISNGTVAPTDAGELGRLTTQLEAYRDAASMYGAPDRQTEINRILQGSEDSRLEVKTQAREYRDDPNQTFDIRTRKPTTPPNPVVDQYNRNRSSRTGDFNDPRIPEP